MLAAEPRSESAVAFGLFELDLTTLELRRGGESLPLPHQPARLLALLLRRAGSIVTREEIRRECWPDTVHGAGPAINAAVRQIRRALGDDAARPRYIETLARRGYRFIAPVKAGGGRSPATPVRWLRLPALAVLVSVALLPWLLARRSEPEPVPPPAPESVRLGYARALRLLDREEPESLSRALELFRSAVAAEPAFASAHAGEAEARLRLGDRAGARSAAVAALELAPRLARAHHVLGLVRLFEDWDTAAAERSLRRAVRLDPAAVRYRVSLAYLMVCVGRGQEAVEILDRVYAQDPIEPAIRGDGGFVYYLAHRYDKALELCETASELDPQAVWAEDCVQNALVGLGRYDEAARRIGPALARWGIDPAGVPWSARLSGQEQLRAYWDWRAERLKQRGADGWHYLLAGLYADLGRRRDSLTELELAAAERPMVWVALGVDPRFERFHGDPRFDQLLIR